MANKPAHDPADFPRIYAKGLPSAERKAANILDGMLGSLHAYSHDFAAAVALFNEGLGLAAKSQLLGEPNWGSEWMHIAGRDGAISIFNFGQALEGIRAGLVHCSTVSPMVDTTALRLASKLMRAHFPRFEAIRHSVSHAAELFDTVVNRDRNSIAGPYNVSGISLGDASTSVTIRSALNGRKFMNTYDGQLLIYEVSRQTHRRLNQVKSQVYSAVTRTEAETLAMSKS